MIRPATLADVPAIETLAVESGLFPPEEVGFVAEMVGGFVGGELDGHQWWVHEDEAMLGAALVAPEPFSDRVWNVYFLAVAPSGQGKGVGAGLIAHLEAGLRRAGSSVARVIVIETSSTDQFAGSRAFYEGQGYAEEARIREYYGPGDHKVVFWKFLDK